MNDDYTTFSTDLDGDGVEDQAAIVTLDDGSNVIVGDTDGNGEADYAAYDADGNGVYELGYDATTGEYIDLTTGTVTGTDADGYDGSGGNLDGDVVAAEEQAAGYDGSGGNLDGDYAAGGYATDDYAAGDYAGTYSAADVSDMLAMQHETSMAIINNI